MKLSWQIVLGALALSIAAGLAVDWIHKMLHGSQSTAQTGWARTITQRDVLQNANQETDCPASAYQHGAPVTNYRPYLRVGRKDVPQ
jgi:hypothetical protein